MVPREELKARVTRIIAVTRFPFVDQTDWGEGYVTITNEGDKKVRGIEGPFGEVYPAIVVIDQNDEVREIGEVEMEDSVTEAQVPKWRLFSKETGMGMRVKKFFLYVPEGKEGVAEGLLKENNIEYAGLRTWTIREGNLIVTPIKTPDDSKDHR